MTATVINAITKVTRRTSGASGAPASLLAGQIFYNEVDHILYIGYGDNGSGVATSIKAIAMDTFNPDTANNLAGGTASQVLTKSSSTDYAYSWQTLSGGAIYTAGSGIAISGGNAISVDTSLIAVLNSPTFTGVPAGPTAANGTSSSQFATTAFVRATRLDQFVAPTASVDFNAQKITSVADPVGAQDVATKNYVDALAQGLKPKASVKAIATANVATLSGAQTIDGVALVAGDRVLLPFQTTATQNGIYVVAAGAWPRALDADAWSEIVGAYVLANFGSVYAGHGFINTNDPDTGGTVGTTSQTWQEFTGASDIAAGNGISKTGNTLSANLGTGLNFNGSQIQINFATVAALNSPAFTGTPTAPTASNTDNSTQIATTAYVMSVLNNLIIDGGTI